MVPLQLPGLHFVPPTSLRRLRRSHSFSFRAAWHDDVASLGSQLRTTSKATKSSAGINGSAMRPCRSTSIKKAATDIDNATSHAPFMAPMGSAVYTPNDDGQCAGHRRHIAEEASRKRDQVDHVTFANAATVMLQNVPPELTPPLFKRMLITCGYDGAFDLVHVPRALRQGRAAEANNGYAFVNFTEESRWQQFIESIKSDGGKSVFGPKLGRRTIWWCPANTQGRDQCLALWNNHLRIWDPMVRPLGLDDLKICGSRESSRLLCQSKRQQAKTWSPDGGNGLGKRGNVITGMRRR